MKRKMNSGALKGIFVRAKELRKNQTHAEEILWNYLRTKPFGCKFRRQHPFSNYILDFYCHSLKLVIEVDGSIHELEEVKRNDEARQKILEEDGITVIRFSNENLKLHPEIVIQKLETFLNEKIAKKENSPA